MHLYEMETPPKVKKELELDYSTKERTGTRLKYLRLYRRQQGFQLLISLDILLDSISLFQLDILLDSISYRMRILL